MKRRWPNPSFLDFSSLVGHPPRSVQINSLLHRLAFRLRRTCIKRGKFFIVEVDCVPSTVYSPVFMKELKEGRFRPRHLSFNYMVGKKFNFSIYSPYFYCSAPSFIQSFHSFILSVASPLYEPMSPAFGIKLKAQIFMGKINEKFLPFWSQYRVVLSRDQKISPSLQPNWT